MRTLRMVTIAARLTVTNPHQAMDAMVIDAPTRPLE